MRSSSPHLSRGRLQPLLPRGWPRRILPLPSQDAPGASSPLWKGDPDSSQHAHGEPAMLDRWAAAGQQLQAVRQVGAPVHRHAPSHTHAHAAARVHRHRDASRSWPTWGGAARGGSSGQMQQVPGAASRLEPAMPELPPHFRLPLRTWLNDDQKRPAPGEGSSMATTAIPVQCRGPLVTPL